MKDSSLHNEDQIAQQAVEWCMRLHEFDCTEQERQEFKAWHDKDKAHARHYAEALHVWGVSAQVIPTYSSPHKRTSHFPGWINTNFSLGFKRIAWLMLASPALLLLAWFLNYLPNHYENHMTGESGKKITLADGSQVQLNTNTGLNFIRYRHERYVNLKKGEAYFHVAHDQENPFVIKVGSVFIKVTGTEFNVWKYNDDVVVTVINGSVNVSTNDEKYSLTRDMQANYQHHKLAIEINASAKISQTTSWREGILILDDLLLENAITKINPYLDKPLLIADESLEKLRIGGVYNIANIKELPHQIPNILPVKITTQPDGTLVITQK